jgi:tRNA G10  N-methylase Trm11
MPEDESSPKIGKMDPRNVLNDLTGSQWVWFLNSIWMTNTARSGDKSHAYDLRKEHPSPKPPDLLRELVEFFTKKDGKVLDIFAGVGSTLLACALSQRRGFGIELSQQYIDIYKQICQREPQKYQAMPLLMGDARDAAAMPQILVNAPYNLILTDPPYSDMLSRPRTKQDAGEATPFTQDGNDLGNIESTIEGKPPYAAFLDELCAIMADASGLLIKGGYLVVFCKDFQPTAYHHNLLHADMVSSLSEIPGLRYRGMRIWANLTPKLYPYGYPYAFVANQIQQYILIFRKEV